MRPFFLALGLAWQTVSPEVAQHVQAGLDAQKQGNVTQAVDEFRKATQLAPDLAVAFANLGAAYMQERNYSAALSPLKRALELDASLVGVHQMLGYALLLQGYAEEAIPHLEKAQALDGLGIAQLQTGKLSEAIANLQAALEKHPNDPDLLYYLGRASGLLSKQAFDTLEATFPDSARSHQALAEDYAALRRVEEAEKEFSEALRLQPATPGIHLALGEVYAQASQWAKAEEQFRVESKIQPGNAETAYRLGEAQLEQGKTKEARSELGRADRLRPAMPETLYALGRAASLSGDLAAAEKAWSQMLQIEKTGALAAQAHFGLAGLYRKQGKADQAAGELLEYQKLKIPAAGK